MSLFSNEGEYVNPSSLDVKFLLVLLMGPRNPYQIARQAESDSKPGSRISNSSFQRVVKRLKHAGLIEAQDNGYFRLTPNGRLVLDWELERYQKLIDLAATRRRPD